MISLKSGVQTTLKCSLMFVLASVLAETTAASAQTLITLISFDEIDGLYPAASLIADANGNLFGTTTGGGASAHAYGTVFEVAKTSSGYASTPTILVRFGGNNGAFPFGALIADANGNLFGTTELVFNRATCCGPYGTVFEVAKTSSGYASTPTTLVSFDSTNGTYPYSGLIADANGNLFGTTSAGGAGGYGTVFEVAKTSSGYASTPITLVSFDGTNGASPQSGLIADANGNLFGTTPAAGGAGYGTVFEVAKTASGYASTPVTLVSFDGTNGASPAGALMADANGNLFGTTSGGSSGFGNVFEIAKTSSGYASIPISLVSFDGTNGASPQSGLIADANGNLFGTTSLGGAFGRGTVFEVAKTSSGYASTPITLVSFNGTNGLYPVASLIADANGNLFGTTFEGGAIGDGTVFELIGSGFVPPKQFAGTPGSAECTGKSISTLAKTYRGIAQAAQALGYDSVSALQNAVAHYCGN
jgi:uncharacterized repeat protein (TIGR03803 family)